MGEFTDVVLGFPTVVFGGALVVVVGFWMLVLVGGADAHGPGHHGHFAHRGAHHGGRQGPHRALGLDGVPVTVVLSLLVALAWFLSLAGSAALDGAPLPGPVRTGLSFAVLAAAVAGSWSLTWMLVRPLRRLFPNERAPSRDDFVGQLCVIRTGSVTGRLRPGRGHRDRRLHRRRAGPADRRGHLPGGQQRAALRLRAGRRVLLGRALRRPRDGLIPARSGPRRTAAPTHLFPTALPLPHRGIRHGCHRHRDRRARSPSSRSSHSACCSPSAGCSARSSRARR